MRRYRLRCPAKCEAEGDYADPEHRAKGWVRANDLDFCPRCQRDGKMDEAIAAGVLPREETN